MSDYKSTKAENSNPNAFYSFASSENFYTPSSNNRILANSIPSDLENPNLYPMIYEKCANFVISIQKGNYQFASTNIKMLECFFKNNFQFFVKNVDVKNFIQIFTDTQIMPFILSSYKQLHSASEFELINNTLSFILQLISCNNSFCRYLSSAFLFNLILSLEIILSSETLLQNNEVTFSIMLKLFSQADPQSFDISTLIPNIRAYSEFLYKRKLILPHKIIELLSYICKMYCNIDFYVYFIQLLCEDGCISADSFSISISTLYIIIKLNDNLYCELIINILRSRVLDYLSRVFKGSKELSQSFPIYIKLLNQVLKFFTSNYASVIDHNLCQELLQRRDEILLFFNFDYLLSKLDGFNEYEIRSIIGFICVLIQQSSVKKVFKNLEDLFQKLAILYQDGNQITKEKVLKCFYYMLSYKYFRNCLFELDFSASFADFIDCECEKPTFYILEIIEFCLNYYNRKQKMPTLLSSLYCSIDFMSTLLQMFQESSNEYLRNRMHLTWVKLNDLANSN